MARETEATPKTPRGVARAAPGRVSPARVPSSGDTPGVVEVPPARERSEATDDKILAAFAAVTHPPVEARVFAARPGRR